MKRKVKVTFEKEYEVEAESMQEARVRARELAVEDFDKDCQLIVSEAYDPEKSVADILKEQADANQANS